MPRKWIAAATAALIFMTFPTASPAFFGGGKDKKVLGKKERAAAFEILAGMEEEAQLVFFNTTGKCKKCRDIERLLKELSGISEMLTYEVLGFEKDSSRAADLGVERAPAIVMLDGDGKDDGIRYYGLPLGYEFEAFLQAVVNTARGTTGLAPETEAGLEGVIKPVTITVFVARH